MRFKQLIANPVNIKPIRVDLATGLRSQQTVGKNAVVVVNPDTGVYVTTWSLKGK
jgi:hypothetical protein